MTFTKISEMISNKKLSEKIFHPKEPAPRCPGRNVGRAYRTQVSGQVHELDSAYCNSMAPSIRPKIRVWNRLEQKFSK